MAWYVATSLNTLLTEINLRFPTRSKRADGSIGDASHQARPSDHNPDWRNGGVVRARDFTHDPPSGCDIHREVRRPDILLDPRQKYIISNGKMMSSYPMGMYPAYAERPYSGSNKHTQHAHISIKSGWVYENDKTPWYGVSQEVKMDEEVARRFDEQQRVIDDIRDVLGKDYGDIGKALYSRRRNPDGTPAVDSSGKPVYDETIELVNNKVDELAMHIGVLTEHVQALAQAVQALSDG